MGRGHQAGSVTITRYSQHWHDAALTRRAQVVPPVTPADGGQGESLLWWAQEVTPQETLWALAKEATAAVKRETEAKVLPQTAPEGGQGQLFPCTQPVATCKTVPLL